MCSQRNPGGRIHQEQDRPNTQHNHVGQGRTAMCRVCIGMPQAYSLVPVNWIDTTQECKQARAACPQPLTSSAS